MHTNNNTNDDLSNMVKDYYGNHIKTRNDLRGGLALSKAVAVRNPGKNHQQIESMIHEAIKEKYYGTLNTVPTNLSGLTVLDLGCGAGHDSFMISKLVGENGRIIGIDFTESLILIAGQYVDYHTKLFGFKKPNIEFHNVAIENLCSIGITEGSFDIIISNSVFSVCPDKLSVFKAAFNALKDGGELYFTDIYMEKPLSEDIKHNKLLWSECYSGLIWKELIEICKSCGFRRPILYQCGLLPDSDEEILKLIGNNRCMTATVRLMKLSKEKLAESKPSVVTYHGNIEDFEEEFVLDWDTFFPKGKPILVDSEIVSILSARYQNAFTFEVGEKAERDKIPLGLADIADTPFHLMDRLHD